MVFLLHCTSKLEKINMKKNKQDILKYLGVKQFVEEMVKSRMRQKLTN